MVDGEIRGHISPELDGVGVIKQIIDVIHWNEGKNKEQQESLKYISANLPFRHLKKEDIPQFSSDSWTALELLLQQIKLDPSDDDFRFTASRILETLAKQDDSTAQKVIVNIYLMGEGPFQKTAKAIMNNVKWPINPDIIVYLIEQEQKQKEKKDFDMAFNILKTNGWAGLKKDENNNESIDPRVEKALFEIMDNQSKPYDEDKVEVAITTAFLKKKVGGKEKISSDLVNKAIKTLDVALNNSRQELCDKTDHFKKNIYQSNYDRARECYLFGKWDKFSLSIPNDFPGWKEYQTYLELADTFDFKLLYSNPNNPKNNFENYRHKVHELEKMASQELEKEFKK